MGSRLHFSVSKILYAELSAYANRVAFSLAQQTADALQKEYTYVISEFYGEYTPRVYKRHVPPGLPKSLNVALYPNIDGMFGGIQLSSENMYDDYGDTPDNVLRHFLDGYHGDPSRHIESGIKTEEHMYRYRDLLANRIKKFVPAAEQYAKSFSYSMI